MSKDCNKTDWLDAVFAIKNRVITSLLATLVITLLAPITSAVANGSTPELLVITIGEIEGVTPPVAGEAPVESIASNGQYSGTVVWSSLKGPLVGNFDSLTTYLAVITLTPEPTYTLDGVANNFFTVEGASSVTYYSSNTEVYAIFNPILGDATDYLDETFDTNGSINIKDFFGEAPLNDSDTAVGPIKVDRIAVDSQDRIVVLASFYDANNQLKLVPDAERDAVGTGFQNSMNIAGQQGNVLESSAAVDALDYVSTVADVNFTDWYLPSLGELYELYNSTVGVTLMDVNYWSSTQANASNARYKSFLNGSESASTKSSEFAVRPIRSGTLVGPTVGNTGPGGGTIFYVASTPFYCGSTLSETCNYLEVAPSNWFGVMGDPSISWSTDFSLDNHILFRLEDDGSYDYSFGVGGPKLRAFGNDTPKPYVLVTTTGSCYGSSEKVDLEIVSLDKILVLLSGTDVVGECFGDYHNFVVKYDSYGIIDEEFADEGVIGSLERQSSAGYIPEAFFIDFTVDADGQIVIASFSTVSPFELVIYRFDSSGVLDDDFCADYIDPIDSEYPCDPGTSYVPIASPEILAPASESDPELIWLNYRTLQIMADGTGGYVIGFTGPNLESLGGIFSQLIRLENDGQIDPSFAPPAENLFLGDEYILPNFFVTDLVPDGPTGFLMSGTFLGELDPESLVGFMIRIKWDGSYDIAFVGTMVDPESGLLIPLVSSGCFNTALLGNDVPRQSSIGIITANLCVGGAFFGSSVKAFSPLGSFRGEVLIQQLTDETDIPNFIVNQLEGTSTGKILALSGTRPTTGALGFLYALGVLGAPGAPAPDWTEATITRYQLPDLLIALPDEPLGITGPEQVVGVVGTPINPFSFTVTGGTGTETITVTSGYALPEGLTLSSAGLMSGTPTAAGTTTTSFTVTDSSNETLTAYIEFVFTLDGRPSVPTPPVVVYVAPTPVPYLKTLTTPKLNLKDDKLICTPGTYNAGYTLDGVVQGSTTALFTPSSFTYNLLINGITQTSLAVTSSSSSQSWNMPTGSTGVLVTCSVTVTANGLTNTDKSGDNSAGASSALTTQSAAIATANATYAASLAANTKAYQKALVDNRTQWRSTTEKIRTDYYAERDRIRSLPSTKATRALSSAALKAYTAALKKSAADYKASGPAALAAKDAANTAALTARDAAIAKANTAYGTAIESIGYGVLIP